MKDSSMNPAAMTLVNSPAKAAAVAGLYAAACVLSLILAGSPGSVAVLWFANPVAAVGLWLAPWALWPWLLACLGLANFGSNLAGQSMQWGVWWVPVSLGDWGSLKAMAYVPGNLLEAAIGGVLLKRVQPRWAQLLDPLALGRTLMVAGLVPVLPGALVGASLVRALHGGVWVEHFQAWFAGTLIGTLTMLPLALSMVLTPPRQLRQTLLEPKTLLVCGLVVALSALAISTLPFPFVAVSLLLTLTALAVNFMVTALATLLVALLEAVLIHSGVLMIPPAVAWWSDSLFYLAVLGSLEPGVLLSAALGGREATIERLRQSEARLRSLYVETPVMLHSLDAAGRVQQVSRRWLEGLGYPEHEVLGRHIGEFMTPESARKAREEVLPAAMRDGRIDGVTYQMVRRDGSLMDVVLSAIWERDAKGASHRSMAVMEDVTEKLRLSERSHFAEHDPLTGLPNRMLLQDRLLQACTLASRTGQPFAVGFLDLDHFKEVNDRHGHEAGDELLREVARRLSASLRESDTLSRLAGDEFVLLLRSGAMEPEAVVQTGRRLLDALTVDACMVTGNDGRVHPVVVSGSLGLAVHGLHGTEGPDLMQKADEAMYKAKRAGRNQVICLPPLATR